MKNGKGTDMSSGEEYSAGLCDIPPLHRTKIIDVGTWLAVYTLY